MLETGSKLVPEPTQPLDRGHGLRTVVRRSCTLCREGTYTWPSFCPVPSPSSPPWTDGQASGGRRGALTASVLAALLWRHAPPTPGLWAWDRLSFTEVSSATGAPSPSVLECLPGQQPSSWLAQRWLLSPAMGGTQGLPSRHGSCCWSPARTDKVLLKGGGGMPLPGLFSIGTVAAVLPTSSWRARAWRSHTQPAGTPNTVTTNFIDPFHS